MAEAQFNPQNIRAVDQGASGANDGTSWEDAYTDLQDALEFASDEENGITSIWVAEGTYVPSVGYGGGGEPFTHWQKTFRLIDAVKIYGGFAGVEALLTERDPETNITILSGDLGDPAPPCGQGGDCFEANGTPGCDDGNCCDAVCAVDPDCCDVEWDEACAARAVAVCSPVNNAFHVVTGHGVGPDTALNGFTVTGGRADMDEGDNFGGGMFLVSANPKVVRCIFTDNLAGAGGGIAGGQPVVVNCSFISNTATHSGGAMDVGEAVIVNCVFSGNVAQSERGGGGGGAIQGGGLILANCNFGGNAAQGDGLGGGILLASESANTLTNCILWGNTDEDPNTDDEAEQINWPVQPEVSVTYSCIEGLDPDGPLGGEGNIDDDPLFCDAANGNLRLGDGSPCIDTANNDDLPNDVADVDDDPTNNGDPIPWDLDKRLRVFPDPSGTVDMGAYENQHDQSCAADLDGDGDVGASDLLILLAAWGPCPGCAADLDCNLVVGASDLLILLGKWGSPCDSGGSPPQGVLDCLNRFCCDEEDMLALEKCLCAVDPECDPDP